MMSIITENGSDMPSAIGVPSKYCIKSVLANNKYFAQENLSAINKLVKVVPVNIKNIDIPMANELFRKTEEIIKAIVASMIMEIE